MRPHVDASVSHSAAKTKIYTYAGGISHAIQNMGFTIFKKKKGIFSYLFIFFPWVNISLCVAGLEPGLWSYHLLYKIVMAPVLSSLPL